MLIIKKRKFLYIQSKISLISTLILLWLLSPSVLQAVNFNSNINQEEPRTQSIWGSQINPTLDLVSTPFADTINPNDLLQTSTLPWGRSTSSFMSMDVLPMSNNFGGNSNMAMNSPHILNRIESPFCHFSGSSLVEGGNFSLTPQPFYSVSGSSKCPVSSDKPISSPLTRHIREKQPLILPTDVPDDKRKKGTDPEQIFQNQAHLEEDVSIDTKKKNFSCIYCSKKFTQKSKLKRHIVTHIEEGSYECSYCHKKFKEKGYLKKHIRGHKNETPYECTYCQKKFTQQSYLKTHIRIHTNEKPYKCTYCHKRFTQQSNLITHTRLHTNEKPFKCTYCSKLFAAQSNLNKHLRTHSSERKYACTYCDKKFKHNNTLITHIRTHTNEKPYECPHCHKGFTQKSNLKKHVRTHTKEKPYACNYCNKSFSAKYNLKRHVKSQHAE